jgi:hypothetical protein
MKWGIRLGAGVAERVSAPPHLPISGQSNQTLARLIDLVVQTGRKHSIDKRETLETLRLLQQLRAERRYPPLEPIGTAPEEPGRPLLLWCPEQAGWQTGEWLNERGWVSTLDANTHLEPTHWMEAPPRVDC